MNEKNELPQVVAEIANVIEDQIKAGLISAPVWHRLRSIPDELRTALSTLTAELASLQRELDAYKAADESMQEVNYLALKRAETAERERDGLLTMFRDALVEEILAYPEGKEVDAPDFADAVIDRLNTARGAGNGRGE